MHVVCERCRARYEFESSAIPAAGYTAQCSHCSAHFFVAPEGGVHRGPPAAAPKLDAAAGAPPAAALAHERPAKRESGSFSGSSMADTLAAEGERYNHERSGKRPSLASLFDDDLHQGAKGALEREDDLLAQDIEPDEKLARPSKARKGGSRRRPQRAWAHITGRLDPQEQAPPRSRAKFGLVVGMACVALVTLGVVVGVTRSKQLHLPTQVPPPLHIVHDPPQAAVEAFSRGLGILLHDNEADLDRAAEAFAAARALDDDYTDAWAGEALACLLRGQNTRERLEVASREFAAAGEQVLALAEAQGARAHVLVPEPKPAGDTGEAEDGGEGAGDQAKDPDEGEDPHALRALEVASASLKLRAMVRAGHDAEQRLVRDLRSAQQDLARAASLLLHADQLPAQTPMLATVLALWYADDPTAHALVGPQLRIAEQLGAQVTEQPRRTWSNEPTPTPPSAAPYAAWRMLARARLAMAQQAEGGNAQVGENDPVVVALEAALRLDPALNRARWQLASYLLNHGRAQEAGAHVRQLAHAEPRHERAYALWQRWSAIEQSSPK